MSKMTPPVDGYLRKNARWQPALSKLREIVLDSGLTETVKWRVPAYTLDGTNVVLLNCLKEYCAIAFFKGALMKDAKKVFVRIGENTQAARMIKFTDVKEVVALEKTLRAYIKEAIEVQKSGKKYVMKTTAEFKMPEELEAAFKKSAALKKAFAALTPGRQRGYLLHFSSAKQSATRAGRIEKATPLILEGKGLDDDYRK